jgi:hypothetical protein
MRERLTNCDRED